MTPDLMKDSMFASATIRDLPSEELGRDGTFEDRRALPRMESRS